MLQQRSLFRQEAIDFQQQHRNWGEVTLLQPLSSKVMVWLIILIVTLMIGFLLSAHYARKETVMGYLTPTAGVVKIFAPRQGTIKAIHVQEGDQVQEGQPLLTIATDQITADGENVDTVILDTLIDQKDLLTQQITAQEHRTAYERERLVAQIHDLEIEISHLEAQIATQSELIQLSESFVSSAARLSGKGYMSESEYKHRQETYLQQRQNLSSLNQNLAAKRSQLVEVRYALEELPIVGEEKVQLLRSQLSEVAQHVAEINGRRAYVIRAPAAGRVSTLQAIVGGITDSHQLQLSILPTASILQAELLVPTRAIGFVRPGQEVRILYDAFPYQHFGTYGSRVIKVAQTILTSSDISAPVALSEPVYKVTVALDRLDVDAHDRKIPLQADMLLKAEIILNRRSLIGWFLDPLASVRM